MLSALLLKPPVKQVSPAVTHPSAYLPSPLEVFFPKYLSKYSTEAGCPFPAPEGQGMALVFLTAFCKEDFTSSKEIHPLLSSFPIGNSFLCLIVLLPPLGSINCFQHPPQSMLAKTGHVIPAQPHH